MPFLVLYAEPKAVSVIPVTWSSPTIRSTGEKEGEGESESHPTPQKGRKTVKVQPHKLVNRWEEVP